MLHRSVIWPLLSLLALVAGCAQGTSAYRVLGAGVQRPERAVVLFFVDGMDRRVFHRLVEQGDLPNFERIFVTGGVGVEHAIASMPAITYPNAVSLITGRFPGHHGVLGNRWFDRLTLIDQDYGSAATYRSVNRDFESATLYELMPDRLTVNVQGHTRRGVTHTFDHWALSGIDWFLGSYTSVDQRVGACIDRVVNLARREGRWPTVLTAYFPGVDEVGHRYGPGSRRYLDALRNADRQIGRIYDGVEASGMGSRTYYVLVSDHGLVATPSARSVDLNAWLEDRCKLRVYRGHVEDARYDRRRWRLRRFDAVVVDGAFRRAAVHLRGSAGWAGSADDALIERVLRPGTQTLCGTGFQPVEPADHLCGTGFQPVEPADHLCGTGFQPVKPADRLCGTGFQPVEPADHLCGTGFQPVEPADHLCGTGFQPVEPKALYDLTGVALVCVRSGPDRVAVYSRRGSATVERRIVGGLRQYRMTVGSDGAEHDPVGYDADSRTASLVSSGWHSSSEWLAATAGSTCPDFVPQVVEMFDSPRAGDLVVFADDQASFGDRFAGGHGSCLGSDMVVPLYFSGPDLPAGGRIPAGRIVDVMPTILDLLGLGDRLDRAGPIDGVSLAEALRTAGQGR